MRNLRDGEQFILIPPSGNDVTTYLANSGSTQRHSATLGDTLNNCKKRVYEYFGKKTLRLSFRVETLLFD